jgi:hypothetical protein
MILASFWGNRERRSRSTFPPITFFSKWGEHIVSRCLVGGLEEITVSLCGVWGALCLHIASMEISISC